MSFLDRLNEQKSIPNPAIKRFKFNGSGGKGNFGVYNPSIEDREKRKTTLKKKTFQLLFLGTAKQISASRKAKGNNPALSLSSNFFTSYETDVLRIWRNGSFYANGIFKDLKEALSDDKAKVYHCFWVVIKLPGAKAPELMMFSFRAGSLANLKKATREAGGWKGNPWLEVSVSDLVEGESFDYFNMEFKTLDMAKIPADIMALGESSFDKVNDFIEYERREQKIPQNTTPSDPAVAAAEDTLDEVDKEVGFDMEEEE